MAEARDTFRMNPVTLGALIGGVVAFVVTGAIIDVLWVVLGIAVGGGLGWLVRRYAGRAATFAEAVEKEATTTKAELMEEARRLDVPGRSTMAKHELLEAITEQQAGSAEPKD